MPFAPHCSGQRSLQRLLCCFVGIVSLILCGVTAFGQDSDSATVAPSKTVRIATCQAQARSVDWRLKDRDAVLAAIDRNIADLEQIIHKASQEKCDALALPEDTLGLLHWLGANEELVREILPIADSRMLSRLGAAAAKENMYLIVCSDTFEADGGLYNTAFLLGRDGKEIGRYHKVCPTWSESGRRSRGTDFPVFETPDLGTVGLSICYDLVIPETARCLALQGADIVFFPTMGGAAMGDDDIGMQALRVRAAENQIYLAVAFRGSGAMIISPQGKILSEAKGNDGLAIADINPRGGREGGDAANFQQDMRARLFRERNPAAFAILTDLSAPVLAKVPEPTLSRQRAGEIFERMLTVGQEEFNVAQRLAASGEKDKAIAAYERLIKEYPGTWIDRVSQDRLKELGVKPSAAINSRPDDATVAVSQTTSKGSDANATTGLAQKYFNDKGIADDPHVLFADNFESGQLDRWDEVRGTMKISGDNAHAGAWCVHVPMTRSKDNGGDSIKWFMPGSDTVYARCYVKFSENYQYNHHFITLMANLKNNRWSAFGKAGNKPDGTYYSSGMEPAFAWGKNPSPGEVNLYSYFLDMDIDPKMNKYWGNSFFPPGPGRGSQASDDRRIPKLNQWQCWEFMVQANSQPDVADGKQAMWLDGELVGQFDGIRWRNDLDLKINCFWLQHFGYDSGDPTKQYWKDNQAVWFDDVVVATEYIGPMSK